MDENCKYPKILVVTEEPLRNNSFGFGRTISNIFKNYPKDLIHFYVQDGSFKHPDYFTKYSVQTFGLIKFHCKHLRWYAALLNEILSFINYSLQYLRRNRIVFKKIAGFSPEIILSVPMNYSTLLEGYLISKKMKLPHFIYFMDDTFKKKYWHVGGITNNLIQKSLEGASGWIMISKPLASTFSTRYKIFHKPVFILHNPININNSIKKFIPLSSSTYSVAYAGSIHNFHYDALIKVAEAIYYLKNKGISIDLIIYTNQISWDTYREILQKFGVINGGVIPYDNLFSILNKSDILLCTTSFDSKFKNIVSTSVFTKITDYLASARPVWCFGPEYSANNFFLKENSIGYANSFEEVISIVDFLITRLKNREFERKIVNKQLVFLQDKYDENIIMKSLIAFLNSNN